MKSSRFKKQFEKQTVLKYSSIDWQMVIENERNSYTRYCTETGKWIPVVPASREEELEILDLVVWRAWELTAIKDDDNHPINKKLRQVIREARSRMKELT